MRYKLTENTHDNIFYQPYVKEWSNFTTYHDPIWSNSKYYKNISEYDEDENRYSTDQSWEDYCNDILKGTGKLHWVKSSMDDVYINFKSEEDMISFILKWS